MKHSTYSLITFFALILLSCTSDSPQTNEDPISNMPLFSEFTYAEISPLTSEIALSTNYILEGNKIISATHFEQSFNSGSEDINTNSIYAYIGDKISEITTFNNGHLIRKISYHYDTNGELTAYINAFNNLNTQQSFYDRHTFIHTNDTIFVERRKSTDGVNYNIPVSDIKMVLDASANRIYFQTFDYININEQLQVKSNIYDANRNMISQETSAIYPDGSSFFSNLQTYTYHTEHNNSFYYINENTYGRKNMMLLYHLELDALNSFNPKLISPKAMTNFDITTSGTMLFPLEINSTTNDGGYIIFDEYIVYLEDNQSLASKFTIEYELE